MPQPPNGHNAVDLGALKAAAAQREQIDAQRTQLTIQAMVQNALIRECGNPLPSTPVLYFAMHEAPTPAGPQLGMFMFTCCSQTCLPALRHEITALARRMGATGKVTLLAEGRRILDIAFAGRE